MNTAKHKTAQSIKELKAKFEEWENMLVGEDIHSIRKQIYGMIWDTAVFKCINESKKYVDKDNEGKIKQNGMT